MTGGEDLACNCTRQQCLCWGKSLLVVIHPRRTALPPTPQLQVAGKSPAITCCYAVLLSVCLHCKDSYMLHY
jgi:hypothetical protein